MTLTGSEISLVGVEAREVEEKGKYSKTLIIRLLVGLKRIGLSDSMVSVYCGNLKPRFCARCPVASLYPTGKENMCMTWPSKVNDVVCLKRKSLSPISQN